MDDSIRSIAKTAVSAICIDQDRILLVRRSPPTPELWAPPGGKVEPNENLISAVLRETYEEIGIPLRPRRLVSEVELHGSPHSFVIFSFLCEVPSHPNEVSAESDALDVRWLHLNQARAMNLAPGVRTILGLLAAPRQQPAETATGADR